MEGAWLNSWFSLQNRVYLRDCRDYCALQPDPVYTRRVSTYDYLYDYCQASKFTPYIFLLVQLEPPSAYKHNSNTSICTKFVHTSTNKVKCPINCVTVCSMSFFLSILCPKLKHCFNVTVDARRAPIDYRSFEWRVYSMEWINIQFWDYSTGQRSTQPCRIPFITHSSFFHVAGARYSRTCDGVEPQRAMDGDRWPWRYCEVLAIKYE